MSPILLTVDDNVAWLRFNRPDRLNALDVHLTKGFREAIVRVVADKRIKVLVLSGEGRAFVSGGDLRFLHGSSDRAVAARTLIEPMHDALKMLRRSEVIVIASVNGAAVGAGMSLALMADFVVSSPDASFSMGYIGVGASPDCGGSWALPRVVGERRAVELALLGRRLTPSEALTLGIVHQIANDLDVETAALARRIARVPQSAAFRTRRLIEAAQGSSLDTHLDRELESFIESANTSEFSEALSTFVGRSQA